MKNQVIPYNDTIPGKPRTAPNNTVKKFMPTAILYGERRKSTINILHMPTRPLNKNIAAILRGFENIPKHI